MTTSKPRSPVFRLSTAILFIYRFLSQYDKYGMQQTFILSTFFLSLARQCFQLWTLWTLLAEQCKLREEHYVGNKTTEENPRLQELIIGVFTIFISDSLVFCPSPQNANPFVSRTNLRRLCSQNILNAEKKCTHYSLKQQRHSLLINCNAVVLCFLYSQYF